MPRIEASAITTNSFSKSGMANTGACVRACFTPSNASVHAPLSGHSQGTPFLVRFVSGATKVANPCMNLRKYVAKPTNDCMSATFCGRGHSCTTFTLAGSTCTPCSPTMNPRNFRFARSNSHLSNRANNCSSCNLCSTISKCFAWSSALSLNIRISSI